METLPDYKPLKKEQHLNINQFWNLYRGSIGLECDYYRQLVDEKRSAKEIELLISARREYIKGDVDAWRSLRQENS